MVTFRCYISSTGVNEIERWLNEQGRTVQAITYAILEGLRHRDPVRWRRKPYGELRNRFCSGLGEIRIEFPPGEHYRILGTFDPTRKIFTLLHAFRKTLDPDYTAACPEAQRRRHVIEQDPTRAQDCHLLPLGRSVTGAR
jgi:hypothetical protein